MNCSSEAMRLYAITGEKSGSGLSRSEQVQQALAGGATFVQLRAKTLPYEQLVQEGRTIAALCRQYNVPFVMNDDIHAAYDCGADGVHLGQQDGSVAAARELLGKQAIIGVSAHSVAEAVTAEAAGADYLGVGAVFTTDTKQDATALPHETVHAVCQAVSIPVVAIGGINAQNICTLAGLGLDGVAVVSALFAASDIRAAAEQLRALAEEVAKK